MVAVATTEIEIAIFEEIAALAVAAVGTTIAGMKALTNDINITMAQGGVIGMEETGEDKDMAPVVHTE